MFGELARDEEGESVINDGRGASSEGRREPEDEPIGRCDEEAEARLRLVGVTTRRWLGDRARRGVGVLESNGGDTARLLKGSALELADARRIPPIGVLAMVGVAGGLVTSRVRRVGVSGMGDGDRVLLLDRGTLGADGVV